MRQLIGWIVCILGGSMALAQPYQIQQGNVLDRNPQLGSGGFNSGSRQYQVNSANRIVTGNVTGGAGFRGFSPISDPSAFGLSNSSLPTDRLYSFRRDTYNSGDMQSGTILPYARSSYFSSSSAITNTGAIGAGLNRPGTSQVLSPYVAPRMDLRVAPSNPLDLAKGSGALTVSPRVERWVTGQEVSGPVNGRLLTSPLFGAVRAVPADVLAGQARESGATGAGAPSPIDNRIQPQRPFDQTGTAGVITSPMRPGEGSPLQRLLAGDQREPAANAAALSATQRPPGGPSPSGLTSPTQAGDTFAGMQRMAGELLQPLRPPPTLAETARQQQRAVPGPLVQPLTPTPPAGKNEPAPKSVTLQPSRQPSQIAPMRTFVGTEQSAINRYLSQAEGMIRAGQYYKATDLYDMARSIDSRNPLPLLGRSLSLLAAGEYVSSAASLFQAVNSYDALAQFPVDLPAFIPDIKMLDRRRADIEQRLEAREDYRLRFLLGYAEYSSGMQKLGLQDMSKAAMAAPPELDSLRRFVSMLSLRPISSPAAPGVR